MDAKLECISPQIERQRALFTRSFGKSPASGRVSFKYSPIASVSHTLTPSWVRQGTRQEGDSRRSSARIAGSSGGTIFSAKASPENLASSQPRSDQEP
jgi:hypothetical protein